MKYDELHLIRKELFDKATRQKERYIQFSFENKVNEFFLSYGMHVAYMDAFNKLKK